MADDEEVRQLLRDIRDTQTEHIAEYKRVTEHSLELPQRAVARQEQMVFVYRRLPVIGGRLVTRPLRHLNVR